MTHDTQASLMKSLSPHSITVEQGEGNSPITFEICFDKTSSEAWRKKIMEKVRQFSIAIQTKAGYPVLLRRKQLGNGTDILNVDITQAKQSYMFLVNDFECEVRIYKEVI